MRREDLPSVELTVAELAILFARAIDLGNLDHADELADVVLVRNDDQAVPA